MDVAYSLKNRFTFAAVKNAAGRFQLPGLRGIAAAASSVKRLPADNSVSIVNPSKKAKLAYPISTFTWVIVPLQSSKAADLRLFIGWAVTKASLSGRSCCSSRCRRSSRPRHSGRWHASTHK